MRSKAIVVLALSGFLLPVTSASAAQNAMLSATCSVPAQLKSLPSDPTPPRTAPSSLPPAH